jgi:putative photosynthetic complex assembly protein 2
LMRSSAKLNLFLGVRNLGEGFFPPHLQHLLGFMRQRRMNPLMPVSLLLAGAIGWHFGNVTLTASSTHEAAAATIIATLAVLALFEHLLMILPVPAETLWRWSLANRRSSP